MRNLLLLKIGGGVITDKNRRYGLRDDVVHRLVAEIAEAYPEINETLIVGHGGGSYPHYSANQYQTHKGFVNEQSRIGLGRVHYDATKLNQIMLEEFLNAQLPVYSFSPSSFLQIRNGVTEKCFIGPIEYAIEKGLIPMVYGDSMVDGEKGSGIYSTEKIFDELIKVMRNKYEEIKVIHVSSEEGVLVGDKVISVITSNNFEQIKVNLGGSNGIDVTGGMLHKVEECLLLASRGISSQIISGLVPGRVRDVIIGKEVVGTTIC